MIEPDELKVYFYAEKYFDIGDDWKNVFLEHDDHDDIRREYIEEKPFNVTQYVEEMGGYNESLVDKEMFATSEMREGFFKELRRRGMLQEIVEDES